MQARFEDAIDTILKHEGGFVNDSVDPGGATNFGMSIRYLKSRGDLDGDGFLDGDLDHDGDVDVSDIRNMTKEQAKALYKSGFWDSNNYSNICDQAIATKIFDMTVNMGAKQAHLLTQRAVNELLPTGNAIGVDGILGPTSFKTINIMSPSDLLRELRVQHADFYLRLIEKKPQFEKYRNGWLRRAAA